MAHSSTQLTRGSTSDPKRTAAIVDRITFEAHIVETGTESYRLRASQRKRAKSQTTADRDRTTP